MRMTDRLLGLFDYFHKTICDVVFAETRATVDSLRSFIYHWTGYASTCIYGEHLKSLIGKQKSPSAADTTVSSMPLHQQQIYADSMRTLSMLMLSSMQMPLDVYTTMWTAYAAPKMWQGLGNVASLLAACRQQVPAWMHNVHFTTPSSSYR